MTPVKMFAQLETASYILYQKLVCHEDLEFFVRFGACEKTIKANIGVQVSLNWPLVTDSIRVPRPCMTIGVPIIEALTLLLRQQANWFAELSVNYRWYETSCINFHEIEILGWTMQRVTAISVTCLSLAIPVALHPRGRRGRN